MTSRKIVWDKIAFDTFTQAVNYIQIESPQNADKVKRELLEKIEGLARRPELYGPDKYKQPNDGNEVSSGLRFF